MRSLKAQFVVDSRVSRFHDADLISRIVFSRMSPLVFGLSMLLLGLIAIWLSLHIQVAHLTVDGKGVGYLDRLNWGYSFVTAIPLIFFLACKAHHKMAASIISFYEERVIRQVMTVPNPESKLIEANDFIDDFVSLLRSKSATILIVTLLVTAVFTIVDTRQEWAELFDHDIYTIETADKEWFNAYANWNGNESKPGVMVNILFNIMAYALQTLVVLFGIHLVAKFILYIHTVMNIQTLSQKVLKTKVYKYHLIAENEIIGLKGLSVVFNIYLSILVAMGLYLALHRWQEMDGAARKNWEEIGQYLNPKNFDLPRLIEPLKNEMWRSGTDLDYAVILIIFFSILFVACYYPMRKWRNFLQETLGQAESERRTMLSDIEATREADPDAVVKHKRSEAKRLGEKIERLKKESVWPNGDKTAFTFLSVIFFTYLFGLYPAWSPFTLVAVIAAAFFAFYKGKWAK